MSKKKQSRTERQQAATRSFGFIYGSDEAGIRKHLEDATRDAMPPQTIAQHFPNPLPSPTGRLNATQPEMQEFPHETPEMQKFADDLRAALAACVDAPFVTVDSCPPELFRHVQMNFELDAKGVVHFPEPPKKDSVVDIEKRIMGFDPASSVFAIRDERLGKTTFTPSLPYNEGDRVHMGGKTYSISGKPGKANLNILKGRDDKKPVAGRLLSGLMGRLARTEPPVKKEREFRIIKVVDPRGWNPEAAKFVSTLCKVWALPFANFAAIEPMQLEGINFFIPSPTLEQIPKYGYVFFQHRGPAFSHLEQLKPNMTLVVPGSSDYKVTEPETGRMSASDFNCSGTQTGRISSADGPHESNTPKDGE